ncbi:hypothetical protein CEXT_137681 [Caerostris extrusa]|uniref:Uncharacterized protein n=1 Tax=Caerostris extrusa TaxID=172846 RepID=A0AAV4UG66_CAEEX|nr:hypothetical protein CEXT_137681 [Caerostris extrusa]
MEGQQRKRSVISPLLERFFSVKAPAPFVELYRIGQQHAQEKAGSSETHEIVSERERKGSIWARWKEGMLLRESCESF